MMNQQVIRILQGGLQSGLGYAERGEVADLLKPDIAAAYKWKKTTRFLWDEKNLDAPAVESFLRWYSSQSASSATSQTPAPTPATRPARSAKVAAAAGAPALLTETFGQGLTRTRVKAKDNTLEREIDGIMHIAAGRARVCRAGAVSSWSASDFAKGH